MDVVNFANDLTPGRLYSIFQGANWAKKKIWCFMLTNTVPEKYDLIFHLAYL